MLTEAQRLKQFGTRLCEVCTKKYLPHKADQKTCGNKCGVILGARNRSKTLTSVHQATCGKKRQVRQWNCNFILAGVKLWELTKDKGYSPTLRFNPKST